MASVSVNGELIIDMDFSTNDCIFMMCPNAKITVLTGYSFSIQQSHIIAGTNLGFLGAPGLWDKIYVENNAMFQATNSTIKYAKIGVHGSCSTIPNQGASIKLTNCNLLYNLIGILFFNSTNNINSYTGDICVVGCEFKSYYFQAFAPIIGNIEIENSDYGIYLSNVNNISIGNANSSTNSFSFYNHYTSGQPSVALKFKNVRTATVVNTKFSNNERGIEYINDITYGRGFLKQRGLGNLSTSTPSFYYEKRHGIFCNNVRIDIEQNHMYCVMNGITYLDAKGSKSRIVNNRIQGRNVGIYALGNYPANNSLITGNTILVGHICGFECGYASSGEGIVINDYDFERPLSTEYNFILSSNYVEVVSGYRAILIHSTKNLITNNNIKLHTNYLYDSYGYPLNHSGIHIRGFANNTISCNNITGNDKNDLGYFADTQNYYPLAAEYPIALWDNPDPLETNLNSYNCNTTNKTNIGFYSIGYFIQPSSTYKILKGNTFREHKKGVFLVQSTVSEFQEQGNKWPEYQSNYNPSLGERCIIGSYNTGIGYCAQEIGNMYFPPDAYVEYPISTLNNCNAKFNCAQSLTCPGIINHNNPPLIANLLNNDNNGDPKHLIYYYYAIGIYTDSIYPEETKYAYSRLLLNEILEHDSILQLYPDINTWYNSQINNNAWRLSVLNHDSIYRHELTLIQYLRDSIDASIEEQTNILDSIYLEMQNDSSLINDYQSVLSSLFLCYNQLKFIDSSLFVIKKQYYIYKNQQVAPIVWQNQYEENEIIINRIISKINLYGIDSITNDEQNSIYNIAMQCPISGGPAIQKARSIAGYYFPCLTTFNDDYACSLVGVDYRNAESQSTVKEIADVAIYPNPTDKTLSLLINNSNIEVRSIEITNVLGTVMYQLNLNENTHQLNIDLTNWLPGFYIIHILTNQSQNIQKHIIKN